MEHKRTIAVGAFAGILIITLFALGFGNLGADNSSVSAGLATTTQTIDTTAPNTTDPDALQQYNAELEQALRTMQERETTYRTQLDLANQTIVQMQDQMNSPQASQFFRGDDDHDDHEEREHEEYGEYDD